MNVHYLAIMENVQEVSGIQQQGVLKFDAMNEQNSQMWEKAKNKKDMEEDDKPKMPELREDQMDDAAKYEQLRASGEKRSAEVDGGVFCKSQAFGKPYKAAPAVFVTAQSSAEARASGNDNVFAWVKDIKKGYATICAKYETDPALYGRQFDAHIHFVVVGEVDEVCERVNCGTVKKCVS